MEDGELVVHLPRRSDSPVGNRGFVAGGGFGETLVLRHKEVHHFFFVPFREQPIYSTRAHVFQIDPNTKKNWLPTSKHAVTVSYFYDSTRNVYRIISLDGTKVSGSSGLLIHVLPQILHMKHRLLFIFANWCGFIMMFQMFQCNYLITHQTGFTAIH